MKNNRRNIAIAEPFFMVQRGLISMVSQIRGFEKPFLVNPKLKLQPQIKAIDPDVIIVNPQLLGFAYPISPRQMLGVKKGVVLLAMETSLTNKLYLTEFDGILSITDTEKELMEKLTRFLSFREETSETLSLSNREIEVLCCVAKGKVNKQIADELNLSIHTVISHRRNITKKLDIHTTSGLTVYAVMNKYISMDDIAAHN